MNVAHTQLIYDSAIMLKDILTTSSDPVENELSRNSKRVVGALLGLFFMGVPAGVCLFDADTDAQKLQKIRAKLINLESVNLDETSPDYQKAVIAREFQKDVYQIVANYTQTAQKIKNILALGSILIGMGSTISLVDSFTSTATSSGLSMLSDSLLSSGLLIAFPTATYGIYHRLYEGGKLDGVKHTLAKQVFEQMSKPMLQSTS